MSAKPALVLSDESPLFAVLTPEENQYLVMNASRERYRRYEVVFKPEQKATQIYLVLRGAIKVAVHAQKKDIIKHVVQAGSIFGESCLTGDYQRRDYAYVLEDGADLLAFDLQAILTVMKGNFAFAQSLLHIIGDRLRFAEQQLEKVVLKDSKSRILEFLHKMGQERGTKIGLETLVNHNMTHQDIADLTGTSRQMVTAVLNQLKKSNVLYFNRKKILFRDLNALPLAG